MSSNHHDEAEKMITFFTGKGSHELPKRYKSIKFPMKVSVYLRSS